MAIATHPRSHPTPAPPLRATVARRLGYVLGAVVNAVLLVLVNDTPGWRAVPFLTEETTAVLGLVNASLVAGLVANLVYGLADPTWLRALGDVVTTSIGLAVLAALWRVFPFAFRGDTPLPELLTRWVLAVGIAGCVIGVIVAMVRLTTDLARRP